MTELNKERKQMNNTILIGRLANDPELSYTPNNQTAVCRFTLAVNRMRKDDGADFIRITVWGKQAENCDRYLSKGRQAAIHGRIQTGSYTNRDGAKVYTTEVVASSVEFLGSTQASEGQPTTAPAAAPAQQSLYDDMPEAFQAAEDDIPF